ncbi:MAG: lipoyl(octanoyl) transferase LipB [Pseudobdellovibrio sp.]
MTVLNCINNKSFHFESAYLGLTPFYKALEIQIELGKLAKSKQQISVVGLEHPAILTLGRRADVKTEVNSLNDKFELPIVITTRGGLATIHSEGQLVIYPIVNLREFNIGVRDYVHLLLKSTHDLLNLFKIDSVIDADGIGIYTNFGKIAFCGVQIQNGISCHGLSLNVRNDLTLFSTIRSCGSENQKLDSLNNYNISYTLEEIFNLWVQQFLKRLIKL